MSCNKEWRAYFQYEEPVLSGLMFRQTTFVQSSFRKAMLLFVM